jgi:DNA polymerase III subunit epsilon
MKVADTCGCFPTGRHYPGIAHLLLVRATGLAEELDPDERWTELPIAFIDVETTGTDPERDRVIELGIVMGKGGEIVGQHGWLVNPGMPIPKESAAVHGITDQEVADKPPFAQILPEVLEVLRGCITGAYNAEFDRSFLLAEFERAGRAPDPLPPGVRTEVRWLDPLVFARELFPGKQSRALGAMCEKLGITLGRAHRATDDAEAALRVLYVLGKDPRMPTTYAAMVREQTRLGRAQDEARRFWRHK